MKTRFPVIQAALVVGFAVLPPALAQPASASFMLGSPATVTSAERSVTIQPDTRWVNVRQGETVRFVGGSAEFAWRFDGPRSRPFDLQQVAPAGALGRPVTVYVAPPPAPGRPGN